MRYRLSELENMQVVREGGEVVGRMMDVRTRARLGRVDASEPLAAQALTIGAGGWLQRIGLRGGGVRAAPAASVIAIAGGRIVVETETSESASSDGLGNR